MFLMFFGFEHFKSLKTKDLWDSVQRA